ncbi:hypothetical protein VTK56DRAFT_2239 [Thermocarpiscus australiensis]
MLVGWFAVVLSATAVYAASLRPSLLARTDHDRRGDAEALPDLQVFEDMLRALRDMQDAYFQRWVGTWPQGIDWTRAVTGTHVAATLRSISDVLGLEGPDERAADIADVEEFIFGYFADLIAYYFGEDAFAIRNQAHDDMLWVVLGWLESIQFVNGHSTLLSAEHRTWYGDRWIPAFAHRARIFWELAAQGWDTKLCGGGMIWNPRLMPYKNAITNQLFISASIGMYLHFPGDPNSSPFGGRSNLDHPRRVRNVDWRANDTIFSKAAKDAHEWLASSNMTNTQGLYVDGFHISGYSSGSNNTKCDERDEMVYSYNQGVILSGLLGLFQATGRETYLREGHTLVQNVIRATGWDLSRSSSVDDITRLRPGQLPPWHGLGRAGVLEDACDMFGICSQDAQTFKGIWMHHFAAFCSPNALDYVHPDAGLDESAIRSIRARHSGACRRYVGWLRHNAQAALGTRDKEGKFGMWWTAGLLEITTENMHLTPDALPPNNGAVDYRNFGVPQDRVWMGLTDVAPPRKGPARKDNGDGQDQHVLVGRSSGAAERRDGVPSDETSGGDPNSRGRGRTLETQGGGLAVLRALWVVSMHES